MVTALSPCVKRPLDCGGSRIPSEKQASLAHVVAHSGLSPPFAVLPPPTAPHPRLVESEKCSMASSGESEEEWSTHPKPMHDWADLKPIPQDDGPRPVVSIAYTEEFREAMGRFRAILAKDERSSRALHLTREIITLNPANYTVWHFRRLVLEALDTDLLEELYYVETCAAEGNYKNYQIWHHRRWLVDKIGKEAALGEIRFTENVLQEDPKNYHAWSHRQWALQVLEDWEWELDYCSELLKKDPANNSAWNQRFFVVTKCPTLGGLQAMRDSEVQYCVDAIKEGPTNESSWRYLRGLFKGDQTAFTESPLVSEVCVTELMKDPSNVLALSFLLDLLCAGFQPTSSCTETLCDVLPGWSTPSELATSVCSCLQSLDAIRTQYWAWRKSLLPLTGPLFQSMDA